jgi:hypothetical protein
MRRPTCAFAQQLADIVLGPAPDGYRRAADVAGPEVVTLPEAVGLVCQHHGRRIPRLISLPAVGGMLTSFAARTNLPGADVVTGGRRFADWLATQP